MRKDVKNPGIGTGGLNRLKIRCVHGHPLSGSNIWLRTSGNRKERRCKTCSKNRGVKCRRKLKERVFQKLGGKCTWRGCRITDIDMLTLDHVKNDGHKHRIRGVTSGDETYRIALRKGCPRKKYQALCANHNLKKELQRLRAHS